MGVRSQFLEQDLLAKLQRHAHGKRTETYKREVANKELRMTVRRVPLSATRIEKAGFPIHLFISGSEPHYQHCPPH